MSFADYFSPADFAHVNWLSGNKRTLLAPNAGPPRFGSVGDIESVGVASRDVRFAIDAWNRAEELGDSRALEDAADLLIQSGSHGPASNESAGEPLPRQFVVERAAEIRAAPREDQSAILGAVLKAFGPGLVGEVAAQFAGHVPTSVMDVAASLDAHTRSGTLNGFLPMGGDEDAGPRDRQAPQPPQQQKPSTASPPLSPQTRAQVPDDVRDAACARKREFINTMRFTRGSYASERDRLSAEIAKVERGDDAAIKAQLAPLTKRLEDKERELILLNQADISGPECRYERQGGRWKRVCRTGPGPIPEIVKHKRRLELQKEIAQLKREIASIEGQLKGPKLAALKKQLNDVCDKLRENARYLVPAEQEYERACGRLDPWSDRWRGC
jgi:hypothetical protein